MDFADRPFRQKGLRVLSLVLLIAFISFSPGAGLTALAADSSPDSHGKATGYAPDRILIKLSDTSDTALAALREKYGLTKKSDLAKTGVSIFTVPTYETKWWQNALRKIHLLDDPTPPGLVKKITQDDSLAIDFAEVDALVEPSLIPNDTRYNSNWHLPKVGAPVAWNTTTGDPSVTIAILDTGVNPHVDLAANLVPGWNTYDNTDNSADVMGHGTGVAGVAGAVGNNSLGNAGLTWNAKIMPVRVSTGTGGAFFSDMAEGLIWAADHGARVANISYVASESGTVSSAAQYFEQTNGVVVISSGNQGYTESGPDNPDVLTVGATDQTDTVASWSNKGDNVDVVAPGASIQTLWWTGNSYGTGSGTSLSAPIVAGIAGQMLSVNPNLTAVQIQDILKQSAIDKGPAGWDSSYGWGRVNAARAVNLALGGTGDDSGIPTAPSNLVTTNVAGNQVALAWEGTATDDLGVLGYQVLRNGSPIGSTGNLAYTDTTVTGATAYSYAVKAYDTSDNYSDTSNSVDVTTPDGTPPSVPTGLTATAPDSSQVVLNWNASTDNVGVAGYKVFRNSAQIATTTDPTYNDTTVVANRTYTYTVRAFDAANNTSIASSSVSILVPDTIAPTAPSNLVGTATSGTNVNLSWSAATDNVAVTGYKIYRDGIFLAQTTLRTYNDATVSAGLTYAYVVQAYDAAGNVSANSNTATVITSDTSAPSVPTNLTVSGRTASSISLSWTGSTDNIGVTGYKIYRNGSLLATVSGTSYTNIGLASGASYSYAVSAVDAAANESGLSNTATSTTLDNIVPSTPANLTVTGRTASSISLSWSGSTDNVGVTGYQIYRNGSYLTSVASTSFTNSGLTNATSYSYTVAAYDAAANLSGVSNTTTGTTLDNSVPTAPSNLGVTGTTPSSVSLSWIGSTDNVGVTGYKIYRNDALLTTVGSTSYTNTGLSSSATYTYRVAAIDAAGNESVSSNTVSATTLPDANAPTITITSPSDGARVKGNVNVTVSAADNIGVTRVELYVDGVLKATSTTSPFTTSWNANKAAGGTHTLQTRAYDAAGNVGFSQIITVTK